MEKAPAKYEPGATLMQNAEEGNSPVSVHVCPCQFVREYIADLLQVTFPEFELSDQSFPVSRHGRFMSLLLWDHPLIVDDRI